LTSLEGLVESAPRLDILTLTNNRLDELSEIVKELANFSELRELNLVGNTCTPEVSFYEWWFPVVRGVTTLTRLEENDVAAEHRYGDEDFVKALISGGGQPGTGDRPSTAGLRVRPPSSKGRPGSAAASSRPSSALSRLSTAHIRTLEKTPIPVLKPPNPRDGIIQKLEPLDNVEVKAAQFRMLCHDLKRELKMAVTSRARTPEISPRERRRIGPPVRSPDGTATEDNQNKNKSEVAIEDLPPAPLVDRPSTSSGRGSGKRKGSRSLSKALEFSETFHPPAAPPIKPSASEKLEAKLDALDVNKDDNKKKSKVLSSSVKSIENQADEAFNVDDMNSSAFVTQNNPSIRSETPNGPSGSWIDNLLDQQASNDSSSEEESGPRDFHKPIMVLQDANEFEMPLASPKYESQRTAEKQRPLTAEQKKGIGGLRKFKIPSKARTHIEAKLEIEEVTIPIISRNKEEEK